MIEHDEFCRLDRRKRAIIEAARTLFVEQGFERTTLGDIVDRAGGSLATIYKLFGNKDGLLEAVVFEKASSGETLIVDAVKSGGSPATRTRDSLERMFASWEKEGVAMNGDPAMLGEMFLGLFVSDVHAAAISHGIGLEHSHERLRARTDFFIAGAGLPRH